MKTALPRFVDSLPFRIRAGRVVWRGVWWVLYRPTPSFLHAWRRFLLRLFGARLGRGVHVYPSATVWAPWNLTMGEGSCLGPGVDCYCVDSVTLGDRVTVSQGASLCTASHDISDPGFRLITRPIVIRDAAWIAAQAFVGPGVTIGEGAVVGARGAAFKDVRPWTVVGGNPARVLKRRVIRPGRRRG